MRERHYENEWILSFCSKDSEDNKSAWIQDNRLDREFSENLFPNLLLKPYYNEDKEVK